MLQKNIKQILDEAEHNIKNYPDQLQCYVPETMAEATNINQGLDNSWYHVYKPNRQIVLLYIKNIHTKMQAKCGSKKTHAINLAKFS